MLYYPYDTLTTKTNGLRLVNNEGQLKRLLLLYKWIIHSTLVFFGYNWRHILPFYTHMAHSLLKLKRFILLVMKGG